jgi:GT2 family glycosyltransferase
MTENPLVTVNILSFNRKDELRNTLTKVCDQDYKNIEVIVVDNASSDGSADMVKKNFPDVQLIQLNKNIGIAGWNKGFNAAKGEYVLVLDDDSYPIANTIRFGINKLTNDNKVGIVACNIVNGSEFDLQSASHSDELEKTTNSFVGCGAIIRRSVLETIGGFESELFLYFHEVEYSLRIIDAGWEIVYCPKSVVVHNIGLANRKYDSNLVDNRKVFYDVRNLFLIIYLHFPLSKSLFLLFRILLGRITYGIFNKKLFTVLSAIRSAFSSIKKIKTRRKFVSKSTQEKFLMGSFAGGYFFYNYNYGLRRPRWTKLN